MAHSVCGRFATRRAAELAVEHLVQDHGVDRKAVSIRAAGAENSAGVEAAGADVASGHPGMARHGDPKLGGMIEVRVQCGAGDGPRLERLLREGGGEVR